MKRFISTLTFATLSLLLLHVNGQQPADSKVRIKIDANVDGKAVKIDTAIDALGDFDMEGILNDLGLDAELGQLNIDINKNFDADAMHSMMEGLKGLDLAEMPPMPPMPVLPESANRNPNRAMLGVYSDTDPAGARVSGLVAGSGAEAAGLKEGDIITKIDERTIESSNNLSEVIGMYAAGESVKITYLREGQSYTTSATLQENTAGSGNWNFETLPDSFNIRFDSGDIDKFFEPERSNRGYLGVFLDDVNGEVKVTGVDEKSAAEEAGLKAGDKITAINGKSVVSYEDVMDLMQTTAPGDKITITYERNGASFTTDATLQKIKNQVYYYHGNDDSFAPGIILDKVMPCPPGSSYSYNSGDGKKNINICITTTPKDAMKTEGPVAGENISHPLLDPANLKVFSNPTTGAFTVEFNLPDEGDTQITITDINGKEVYSETRKNFSGAYNKVISLTTQPKGTYFVKVSQNGYTSTRAVVIQ